MAKAKLEGEVTLNIGPFEKSIRQATAQAKEFSNKVAETGADIAKGFTGIDLAGALKIGVVAYAIEQLAEKFKDVASEALKAFGTHESEVLSLKLNIKGATDEIAEGMIKTLEAMAGVGGTTTQLVSAFRSLKEAGLGDDQAIATIKDLQNEYIKTGVSVDDYAESLRKAQAGGADQGEGLNRLMKSMPDLASMVQARIDDARNSYLQSIGHGPGFATTSLKPGEQAHLDLIPKTPEEFIKEHGLNFQELLRGIHEHAPAGAMDEAAATLEGKQKTLAAKVEELSVTIGGAIAPAMKTFLDDVTQNLPAFTKEVADITTAMGPPLLHALEAFGGALGAATGFIEKTAAEGGRSSVEFVSGLQSRGSIDVGGNYVFGHQPREKEGESFQDRFMHDLADKFEGARYQALELAHMAVPATEALQRQVQGRNEAGGLTPDGKYLGGKLDALHNTLRAPDSPWTPNPGDIDY
jgi:hypothetical protein